MMVLRIGARGIATAALFVLVCQTPAAAEKLIGTYYSAGVVLFFKVPEATVQKLLPAGWMLAPLQVAPLKGANLFVTLTQRLAMQNPDGTPGAHGLLSGLALPVYEKGTNRRAAMVVGGLASTSALVPGHYGNDSLAKATLDKHAHTDANGVSTCEQRWEFFGDDGNDIDLRLRFTCTGGRHAHAKSEAKIYSAAKPGSSWTGRSEEVFDTIRVNGLNNAQSIDFKARGPRLSQLFDGSEQLIGAVFLPWVMGQEFTSERSGPPGPPPGSRGPDFAPQHRPDD